MDGIIDVVELALDWGLPIPKEMIDQYNAEIAKRERGNEDGCTDISIRNRAD